MSMHAGFSVSFLEENALHPKGANTTITAQYKTGKTTLLNNLVWCLATGEPFLGYQTNTLSGRVAMWNYEVMAEQELAWLKQLSFSDAPASKVAILNAREYRIPLLVPHVQDWAVGWLQQHDVEVWMLDPYARAATGVDTDKDNVGVGQWLEILDEIKRRSGVSDLFIATHTGRGEQRVGEEHARGATRLDDWADVRWILTRGATDSDRDTRYFRAEGRGVSVPEFPLSFNPSTGRLGRDGALGSRKEQRQERTDAAKVKKRTEAKRGLLSFLRDNPGANTRAYRGAGIAGQAIVDEAMAELIRDGQVETRPDGLSVRHYLRDEAPGAE